MFGKYKQRKVELEREKVLVQDATEEAKKVYKKLDSLKKTIDAYQKQGAILLLEDLDEDLIKKLQSLTEDNIIIIFCKDGTRMEIKSESNNYKKNSGQIR